MEKCVQQLTETNQYMHKIFAKQTELLEQLIVSNDRLYGMIENKFKTD